MDIGRIAPAGIEDRRRVAERLRKLEGEWLDCADCTAYVDADALMGDIMKALGLDIDLDPGSALLCRLADLVEPSECRMTTIDKGIGLKGYVCSRCGGITVSGDEPKCCVNCGAEVVSG